MRNKPVSLGLLLGALGFSSLALLSQEPSPPVSFQFRDVTRQAGIDFSHDNTASADYHLIETMGGGCAWMDYDTDGWVDLFFVQSSATPSYQPAKPLRHSLYRNQGNGTFTEVSKRVGLGSPTSSYGMGAAVGDYDNDGDPDLYVTGYPHSVLFRNDNGEFVDVTKVAGVSNPNEWGTSAGFFDYDNDGWLDLMVVNYMDWSYEQNYSCHLPNPRERTYCHPSLWQGAPPTLYRNNGDGTFTDVTADTGLSTFLGKGLGVVMADYDDDGWMDTFQANDAIRDFLFRNNGDGSFMEVGLEVGVGYGEEGKAEASMGVDFGDYDRNGWMDIYVTHLDMELHRLFRNLGDDFFTDATRSARLASPPNVLSGFGTKFVDIDNDGWLDILQVNGHILPNIHRLRELVNYAESKQLWLNQRNGTFSEVSGLLGSQFLRPSVGRGLCLADWDNDGDVDFAVANNGQPAELWRNDGGNSHHWLALALVGTESNRNAIGAHVTLHAGPIHQRRQKIGGGSYLSASDPRLFFGLGEVCRIDRLRVRWPSGTIDEWKDMPADQFLLLREGESPAFTSKRY